MTQDRRQIRFRDSDIPADNWKLNTTESCDTKRNLVCFLNSKWEEDRDNLAVYLWLLDFLQLLNRDNWIEIFWYWDRAIYGYIATHWSLFLITLRLGIYKTSGCLNTLSSVTQGHSLQKGAKTKSHFWMFWQMPRRQIANSLSYWL